MFMVKNKVIIHLAINVNRDYIGCIKLYFLTRLV